MTKAKPAPAFTDAQRNALGRCGLNDRQIDALLGVLRDIAADHLQKELSRPAVRKCMEGISSPLAKASAALAKLEKGVLTTDRRVPGAKVIRAEAPEDAVAVYEALADFTERIKGLADDVAEARRQLLACFSGRRRAPTGPVRGIRAVLSLAGANIEPSLNGHFGDIVRTCYQAVSLPDPERALRHYMDMQRLSQQCTTEHGVRIPAPGEAVPKGRAGRPRKRGR